MGDSFKRINFFKGFFTQAEDWQAAEDYHVEKRKLHARAMHTPGIVEGLEVQADTHGSSLTVRPGYAIDARGRDLFLADEVEIRVDQPSLPESGTVYVVIHYREKKVDKRVNPVHPDYTDFAFVKESPVVEVTARAPDLNEAIEIARVELSDAPAIKNPKNPSDPARNEIDRRHVPRAGAQVKFWRPDPAPPAFGVGEYRDGSLSVRPSKHSLPSDDSDAVYEIETVRGADVHRVYLANAVPEGKGGPVIWFIQTRGVDGGGVEYKLYIKNLGAQTIQVRYRVHRLV